MAGGGNGAFPEGYFDLPPVQIRPGLRVFPQTGGLPVPTGSQKAGPLPIVLPPFRDLDDAEKTRAAPRQPKKPAFRYPPCASRTGFSKTLNQLACVVRPKYGDLIHTFNPGKPA